MATAPRTKKSPPGRPRDFHPRPCSACGEGTFRLASARGQVVRHRDDPTLAIDQDVWAPICDACGEMSLDAAQTDALHGALERAYARKRIAAQQELLAELQRKLPLRQSEIEHVLGISIGYVSKVQRGEKMLGPSTYRLLYLLSGNPQGTMKRLAVLDPEIARAVRRLQGHAGERTASAIARRKTGS